VVIGPNGVLYVSNFPNLGTGLGGEVLVFDPEILNFIGAFVVEAGGINQLNRPEGLVFGPDGNLYITSFRADPTDTDSIRIYDGHSGVIKGKINLYASGAPRAFAQALLFGPDGKLFVPISGGVTAGRAAPVCTSFTPSSHRAFGGSPSDLNRPGHLLLLRKANVSY
jgi:DNA-binding beta-propeller fold protein YncE